MPSYVIREKCDGCGVCVEICPVDCLRIDTDNKAYKKYDECWFCGSCEMDCPENAIKLEHNMTEIIPPSNTKTTYIEIMNAKAKLAQTNKN